MPEQGPKRRSTQQGIGAASGTRPRTVDGASPRVPFAKRDTLPAFQLGVSCPPPSEPPRRASPSAEHATVEFAPAPVAAWEGGDTPGAAGAPPAGRASTAPPRGERPSQEPSSRRDPRPAVRVDDVGTAAVRLAARTAHDTTPRVLVQRRALASAPIDHREAFLVSLIDGKLTVAGLVDVSGMREPEVVAALQRLARLGIVAV